MKKVLLILLPLALILCFMVGCQDKEAMAELEKFRAQAAVEEANKALVIEWLEQWDSGNFSIADKIIADNFVLHLSGGVDIKGADEFIESGKPLYAAFPDYKHIVVDALAKGDKVVVRFEPEGTHEGEYMGIPPTRKQVQYTAIAIYKFKEGKCVEMWVDADILGMMQQLGFELKPKEEK
jgi:predicted ester cyclase